MGNVLLALAACSGSPAPPETVLDEMPAAMTAETSATFRYHSATPATFRCVLDVVDVQPCDSGMVTYTNLREGDHVFWVSATSDGGEEPEPAYYRWTIDRTPPPAPRIETFPGSPANDNAPQIRVTSGAVEDVRVLTGGCGGTEIAHGTTSLDANGQYVFAFAGSVGDDTTTELAAVGVDASGNVSPCVTATYVEDSLPPTITLTHVPSALILGYEALSVSYVASEPGYYGCALDGTPRDCSNLGYTSDLSGRHVVTVSGMDLAGNQSQVSATFVVGGNPSSSIVSIGHDYGDAAASPAAQDLLARAVRNGSQYAPAVLRFERGSTPAEIAGVTAALAQADVPAGDSFTDPSRLAELLPGHRVLLILDQNVGADDASLAALASEWRSTIQEFVGGGGYLVVLSGLDDGGAPTGTYSLLSRWGLLDVRSAAPASGTATIPDPSFGLAPAVDHYPVPGGSLAFSVDGDSAHAGRAYVLADGGALAVARSVMLIEDFQVPDTFPSAWTVWFPEEPSPTVAVDAVLGSLALRGPGGDAMTGPFTHVYISTALFNLHLRVGFDQDGALELDFEDEAHPRGYAIELERAGSTCTLRTLDGWRADARTVTAETAAGDCAAPVELVVPMVGDAPAGAACFDASGTRLGTVGPNDTFAQGYSSVLFRMRGGVAIDDISSVNFLTKLPSGRSRSRSRSARWAAPTNRRRRRAIAWKTRCSAPPSRRKLKSARSTPRASSSGSSPATARPTGCRAAMARAPVRPPPWIR
jgi:hypothetical protein